MPHCKKNNKILKATFGWLCSSETCHALLCPTCRKLQPKVKVPRSQFEVNTQSASCAQASRDNRPNDIAAATSAMPTAVNTPRSKHNATSPLPLSLVIKDLQTVQKLLTTLPDLCPMPSIVRIPKPFIFRFTCLFLALLRDLMNESINVSADSQVDSDTTTTLTQLLTHNPTHLLRDPR